MAECQACLGLTDKLGMCGCDKKKLGIKKDWLFQDWDESTQIWFADTMQLLKGKRVNLDNIVLRIMFPKSYKKFDSQGHRRFWA
jgi:hypothetical protein